MQAVSSTYRKRSIFAGKQPENAGFGQKRGLDYYPFGMLMPGRHYTTGTTALAYRYGMNGQERADEIYGAGNSYSAEFWQYDARIGRRWNQDPRPNASISNSATFANNPIWFSDPLGDTVRYAGFKERLQVGFARLASKEFRNNFNTLKRDINTWTYSSGVPSSLSEAGAGGGGIELTDYGLNRSGDKFTIHYNDRSNNASEYGLSRWHYLFEETYHATDYLAGTNGLGINQTGFIGGGDKINSEIDANVWAARNAPGGSNNGRNSGNIENSNGSAPPGALTTPSYRSIILKNQNNRDVLNTILFSDWTAHYRGTIRVPTGEVDQNGLQLTKPIRFDEKRQLSGVQK